MDTDSLYLLALITSFSLCTHSEAKQLIIFMIDNTTVMLSPRKLYLLAALMLPPPNLHVQEPLFGFTLTMYYQNYSNSFTGTCLTFLPSSQINLKLGGAPLHLFWLLHIFHALSIDRKYQHHLSLPHSCNLLQLMFFASVAFAFLIICNRLLHSSFSSSKNEDDT